MWGELEFVLVCALVLFARLPSGGVPVVYGQHAVKKGVQHMPSDAPSAVYASSTTKPPSSLTSATVLANESRAESSTLAPTSLSPLASASSSSVDSKSAELEAVSFTTQSATVDRPSGTCYLNLGGCPANEECSQRDESVLGNARSRQGVCKCVKGAERNAEGECVIVADGGAGVGGTQSPAVPSALKSAAAADVFQSIEATLKDNLPSAPTAASVSTTSTTTVPPPEKLIVTATSKTVRLPFDEVTLSAFAMPAPSPSSDPSGYEYDWRLTASGPQSDLKGTIADSHKPTLRLSDLKPGTYSFVVSVKGAHAFGEASANLTVLPPERINKPPVAVVEPDQQIIRLPSNTALIDGARSTDDDKIASYKWTLETGPLGYSLSSVNGEDSAAMLKLVNLTAGNYTLKLTVVDSDGAADSTLAYVRVDKEIDYPPTANAGEDIVVHLPTSSVVLDASKGTTDDRGITSWEWTRGEGADLAVDMKDTRSPMLQLSGLVEGVYSFILRVTDAANQTASDEVRVFVKPPETASLVADAGKNVTVTLPVNEAALAGSVTSPGGADVVKSWNWTQVRGPSQAVLESPSSAKTKVKSLTKGEYLFNLTVSDGSLFSWSTVAVTVLQTENAPPKASAGRDVSVTLPCSEVKLDGSGSTDDVGIVRWEWTRDDSSLAAGTIVGDSATQSVLRLVDLLPGRYVFKLKVFDGQGGSSEDTASLIVKPSPNEFGEVELILNANLDSLTAGELRTLTEKLELLLESGGGSDSSGVSLALVRLYPERRSGRAVLRFVAVTRGAAGGGKEGEKEAVLPGGKVASQLRRRLRRDPNLLNYDVLLVESVACQNECSGVGQCDQATRACRCDPFWTENPIRKHFGDGESNCDWSLVYVGILSISSVVGLFFACVGARRAWVKRRARLGGDGDAGGKGGGGSGGKRGGKHRYSLLNGVVGRRRHHRHVPNGEEMKSLTKSFAAENSVMVSDSDSGSEVLFQARRTTGATPNGNGHHYQSTADHRDSSVLNGGTLVNLAPPPLPPPPGLDDNGYPAVAAVDVQPEVVVSNGAVVGFHPRRAGGDDDEDDGAESLNLMA